MQFQAAAPSWIKICFPRKKGQRLSARLKHHCAFFQDMLQKLEMSKIVPIIRFGNQKQYSKHQPFNPLISLPKREVYEFEQSTGNGISCKFSMWLLKAIGGNTLFSHDFCSFVKTLRFSLDSYGQGVPETHSYL